MAAFHESKLLKDLPPADQEAIDGIAEHRHYPSGGVIFQEGDPGDGLYVITSGMVTICVDTSQDRSRELSRLGAGEFFGEMAVLDSGPRSATAMAVEATDLFFIPRQALVARIEKSPSLAFSLMRELSHRIRDFNRQYLREVLQAERLTLLGRFGRSVVHDFKNPLAIIGLAAEMGMDESASKEARATASRRVRKQIDRLTSMINELLEFSRGSQSTTILALSDYGLYVQQVIADVQAEISYKPVTFVWENRPEAVFVLMDPRRLAHVFYNLIHNAVEAMTEGGQITLRFIRRDREIVTEIEDNGPGIPEELKGRLFEPFATFGKAHGTGLGLSICRRIIQDHRGQITARNEPGRGAIFSFALPLPASRPPAP